MEVKQIDSIAQVSCGAWNGLVETDYPFLRHEFLAALEQSGSVSVQTGWRPAHLLVTADGELLACMPLYVKQHSWGEYVFDQQWAQAYQQYGYPYYPKLLTAIPFTPCQGVRIAMKPAVDLLEVTSLLLEYIKQLAVRAGISSWHCLFPVGRQAENLQALGLFIRQGVQFQWFNQPYRDFDDYLQTLSAGKRKMLRRERRRISEQGIRILQIAGPNVSEQQWRVFYRFYRLTYLKHGAQPYLNPAFFQQLAAKMPEQLLLVFAVKDENYIAAALSLVGADCLYGRYWGCDEEYHSLHFEVCYYQGIDYCIAHGLNRFDSGAQGEHKIARGFRPVTTYSAHWIRDERFAAAIARSVAREQQQVEAYKQDAANYLPFKQ
ncbi:MAG: GNAT family N-acetyltransferase [Methylococcales bacterium]|nr:GNAT family N-acetyltransferase [Methylococcales bacterium]